MPSKGYKVLKINYQKLFYLSGLRGALTGRQYPNWQQGLDLGSGERYAPCGFESRLPHESK